MQIMLDFLLLGAKGSPGPNPCPFPFLSLPLNNSSSFFK